MRKLQKTVACVFALLISSATFGAKEDVLKFCAGSEGSVLWILAYVTTTVCETEHSYNLYRCTASGQAQFLGSHVVRVFRGGPGCA
jgi:hypothetical protein